MEKKIFTRQQAAEQLNVSLGTLNNWERDGIIRPSRLGRRVYFPESEINRALGIQE